jgi:hypothetical protein
MGGLPRNILPATPRMAAEYAANFGWETAALRGASPYRTNPNGNAFGNPAQVGYPSNYQGFPALPAGLLTWLGTPAGVLVANAIGGYLCDDVGNQLDDFGLGPALVQAGGALDSREAVGLAQAGSFTSKKAIELLGGAQVYADAGAAFADFGGAAGACLIVFRINPNAAAAERWIVTKWNGAVGWTLSCSDTYVRATAHGSVTTQSASLAVDVRDGGWHYALVVPDDVGKTISLFSDLGNVTSAAYLGSITNAGHFSLGYTADSFSGQIPACYLLNVALAASAGTAYWRHGLMAAPFLHARTNPLIAPISANRVGLWSGGNVGQPCIGYDASLVVPTLGNNGTGYVCEDGESHLGVSSTDLFGLWTNSAVAHTAVDGPSGMRDAVRITMAGAFAPGACGLFTTAPANLVGATNVPFRLDAYYKRATVGTTACMGLYFIGDAGGAETFVVFVDPASPIDWIRNGGTVTPVGAGHTIVYVFLGASLNLQDVDFAEVTLLQNHSTPLLTWRRTGAAVAALTTTPSIEVVNTPPANYVYNPFRGRVRCIVGGFQGTAGATFLRFGVAATAGSLVLDYSGGNLRLRIWDAAAALVCTVLGGAVNTARHEYDVVWDSMTGYVALLEGGTVLGTFSGAWTSCPTAVTPLYYGSNGGVNAARCRIEAA